jgi:hypothetical protein
MSIYEIYLENDSGREGNYCFFCEEPTVSGARQSDVYSSVSANKTVPNGGYWDISIPEVYLACKSILAYMR